MDAYHAGNTKQNQTNDGYTLSIGCNRVTTAIHCRGKPRSGWWVGMNSVRTIQNIYELYALGLHEESSQQTSWHGTSRRTERSLSVHFTSTNKRDQPTTAKPTPQTLYIAQSATNPTTVTKVNMIKRNSQGINVEN